MARLASQAKGGYFAAPPEAIDMVLQHLRAPESDLHVFDCCAGEGRALKQLADGLGCAPDNTWCIELEDERAETIRNSYPGWNLIGPASFFGCKIRTSCFSLVWCNPPYDDRIGGGGRIETEFLQKALALVVPKGVICYVCPEHVVNRYETQEMLLTWCDGLSVQPFPAEVRNFNEVVVMGYRLSKPRDSSSLDWGAACRTDDLNDYTIPKGLGAGKWWFKNELTEKELLAELAASPLRKKLQPPELRELARPPMTLGAGHLALLLASGKLDGLAQPPGEPPHVVRGSAYKEQEVTDVDVEETEDATITRETISERIKLCIRVIDHTGEIITLT